MQPGNTNRRIGISSCSRVARHAARSGAAHAIESSWPTLADRVRGDPRPVCVDGTRRDLRTRVRHPSVSLACRRSTFSRAALGHARSRRSQRRRSALSLRRPTAYEERRMQSPLAWSGAFSYDVLGASHAVPTCASSHEMAPVTSCASASRSARASGAREASSSTWSTCVTTCASSSRGAASSILTRHWAWLARARWPSRRA